MYSGAYYQLQTTRWWIFNAHTAAPVAGQFRYYDYALNNWYSTGGFSAAAVGGVPPAGVAWGTDGRLVATPSIVDAANQIFDTFTVSSASAYTVNCSSRNWAQNQWTNYQVRIISGTGAGQVRQIVGSGLTTLTVMTWTVTPDATSVCLIEGSDDALYLMGNASVNMFKFSVSSGAWNLLIPSVARTGAPGSGMSAHWLWTTSEPVWANVNNIVSGRRIMSFRGGGVAGLDYYDIALNAWTAISTYSPANTLFTTGSKYTIVAGRYIYAQFGTANRLYRFDPVKMEVDPLGQFLYPQGVAVAGETSFDVSYTDGATTIPFFYMLLNTSSVMLRTMLV